MKNHIKTAKYTIDMKIIALQIRGAGSLGDEIDRAGQRGVYGAGDETTGGVG